MNSWLDVFRELAKFAILGERAAAAKLYDLRAHAMAFEPEAETSHRLEQAIGDLDRWMASGQTRTWGNSIVHYVHGQSVARREIHLRAGARHYIVRGQTFFQAAEHAAKIVTRHPNLEGIP